MLQSDRWTRWRVAAVSIVLVLIVLYACRVLRVGIANFTFDDALMFVRYAHNMRSGYGIAWNPGGHPVYGLTSLPWLVVVWFGSFLRLQPVTMLVCASWLFGVAALWHLSSWQVGAPGKGKLSRVTLLPFIALPLLLNEHFTISMTNGMETMLALLLLCLFLASTRSTFMRPECWTEIRLALLGALMVLTRPDSIVVVLSFPVAWWLLMERRRHPEVLRVFLLTFGGLIFAELVAAKMYFGTALPLAFYCKWLRGYAGYRLFLNPIAYSAYFLNMAALPCVAIALYVRRRDVRLLAAFLIPVTLQLVYLATVNQIMGWGGRYYVPYLPLLFFPAISLLDSALERGTGRVVRMSVERVAAVALVSGLIDLQVLKPIYEAAGRLIVRHRQIYPEPRFVTSARAPLPEVDWWPSMLAVASMAKALPTGAVVSASEVGALGALAPNVTIIDTSGLNDETIARHGLDPDSILKAKPDLIWLIHSDYTRDFGEMSSAPALLEHYTVYAHALNFGIAIRKDSPQYQLLVDRLQEIWREDYPDYDMAQYKTEQVLWNRRPSSSSRRVIVVQP